MKYFEIADDFATIFEEDGSIAFDGDLKLQVPSSRFVEAYFGRDLGVLPPAVRWISDESPVSMLFERPPEERVLTINKTDYKVKLPWMIYLVRQTSLSTLTVQCFSRSGALFAMDDEIFRAPLPGLDELGNVKDFVHTFKGPIGDALHEVIQKAFEFMCEKEVDLSSVPASWGEFETTEDVYKAWTEYNVADLLANTEWKTADPYHTVASLVASTTEDELPESAFEYLHTVVKTVASDLKVG